MAISEQEIFRAPLYVAEPSEPLFIQNSFTEVQPVERSPISTKLGSKFEPYYPGAMLAESAFMTSNYHQQFASPTFDFGNDLMSAPVASGSDKGSESDCSTTDTANEAMISMQMMNSDESGYMEAMANMGMMTEMESSWQSYAAAGYWGMPYAPPVQAQPQPTWSQQMENAGSSGHRLGRCKPCAFMYKDGCRSGADCPYCHLCPPGEKQRRKRVMRSMQRNLVPGQ